MAAEENEKAKEAKEKERDLDKLISDMAKIIIDENEDYFGDEVTRKSKRNN